MAPPLGAHFERVRLSLLAKADEAGILRHGTLKGSARELVVADFLAANLPRVFDFETGEVVTPDDQRSGQVDVLILPHSAPQFRLGGPVCLAPVHGVASVVEVKSNLTTSAPDGKSELTEAMNTTVLVKKLPINPPLVPWPWSATVVPSQGQVTLPNIPVSIVAFEGPTSETLLGHLESWNNHVGCKLLPNTVTCLRRNYTLFLNDGWRTQDAPLDQLYLQLPGQGAALGDLFDHLMKVLQGWIHHHPATPLSKYLP
jgi:hypothetical protein